MVADVREAGPTTVVLLHGQPGSAADWQWVLPHLEDAWTVVVPDRPGYGRTGGTATGFAGNARATVALLDRLGRERAVVVAHSWAGGAALALASTFPARVAGLVLVSSVGPGERLGWDDRLLAAPVVGELISAATIGGAGLLLSRRRVQSLAAHLDGRAGDAVAALTRLTCSGSSVWRSFLTEQRVLEAELHGLAEALPAIAAPTVILHGRADRLVPVEVAERLTGSIAAARLRILEHAGHLLPHDRPDHIAAAVYDVVSGNEGGGGGGDGGAQTAR
jgi:pimeloyl-ACP methyl ester carboxylesterase